MPSTGQIAARFLKDAGYYQTPGLTQARLVDRVDELLCEFGHEAHARAWAPLVVELITDLHDKATEKRDI